MATQARMQSSDTPKFVRGEIVDETCATVPNCPKMLARIALGQMEHFTADCTWFFID